MSCEFSGKPHRGTARQELKLVFDEDLRTKSPGWKNWVDYAIIVLITVSTLGGIPLPLRRAESDTSHIKSNGHRLFVDGKASKVE